MFLLVFVKLALFSEIASISNCLSLLKILLEFEHVLLSLPYIFEFALILKN